MGRTKTMRLLAILLTMALTLIPLQPGVMATESGEDETTVSTYDESSDPDLGEESEEEESKAEDTQPKEDDTVAPDEKKEETGADDENAAEPPAASEEETSSPEAEANQETTKREVSVDIIGLDEVTSYSGTLESKEDVHWYAFRSEAAGQLRFEVECENTSLIYELIRFDAENNGNPVELVERLLFEVEQDVTYSIKMSYEQTADFVETPYVVNLTPVGISPAVDFFASDATTFPRQIAHTNGFFIWVNNDGTVWGQSTSTVSNDILRISQEELKENWGARQIPDLNDIVMVASTETHIAATALDTAGNIYEWGKTSQYGGTLEPFFRQVDISDVVAISGGWNFFSALKEDGTVWVWGLNNRGQFGNGTTLTSVYEYTPVQVPGLTDVVEIQASYMSLRALKADGTVWVTGQVGPIAPNGTSTTVPLKIFDNTVQIFPSRGNDYGLVRKNDGTIWGWGDAYASTQALLLTEGLPSGTSLDLTPITSVKRLFLSNFVLAEKADGSLWGWGSNLHGCLGAEPHPGHLPPTFLADYDSIYDFSCTRNSSTLIQEDGTIWIRGSVNWKDASPFVVFNNEKWDDYPDDPNEVELESIPKGVRLTYDNCALGGLSDIDWLGFTAEEDLSLQFAVESELPIGVEYYDENQVALTPGSDGRIHLTSGQTAYLKVYNTSGINWQQYSIHVNGGDIGTNPPPSSTVQVASGNFHNLLAVDENLWAWGFNNVAQLGDGTMTTRETPTAIPGFPVSGINSVYASINVSFAVDENGETWAWGHNGNGKLGTGTTGGSIFPPRKVQGLPATTIDIVAGTSHVLFLQSDGTVWGAGSNASGQLGLGAMSTGNHNTPKQISGISDVVAVAAHQNYSLAVQSDGTVWGWGENTNGVLGSSAAPTQYLPDQIPNINSIVDIDAGIGFAVALDQAGTVWSWGDNSVGQLGLGSVISQTQPQQISAISNIAQISAGNNFCLALQDNGEVWSWGNNVFGQLGTGSTTRRTSPGKVEQLANVTSISTNSTGSVAVVGNQSIWCWGANNNGQVGNGSNVNELLPVMVMQVSSGAIGNGPDLTLNLTDENVEGFLPSVNYEFSLDGRTWTPVESGINVFSITSHIRDNYDTSIFFRECDDQLNPVGQPTELVIPKRPAKPTGLSHRYDATNDQYIIENTDSSMEFRVGDGGSWSPCNGTSTAFNIPDISETYFIRYKSPDVSTLASSSESIYLARPIGPVLSLGNPPKDYIEGTNNTMEYQVHGTSGWTVCSVDMSISSLIRNENVLIDIRYRSTPSQPASRPCTITIYPNNQGPPRSVKNVTVNYTDLYELGTGLYFVDYQKSRTMTEGQSPSRGDYVFQQCRSEVWGADVNPKLLNGSFTVTGRIDDATNRPVANAKVRIYMPLTRNFAIDRIVTTDSNGNFSFSSGAISRTYYPSTGGITFLGDVTGKETLWAVSSTNINATYFYTPLDLHVIPENGDPYVEEFTVRVGESHYMRLGEDWIYSGLTWSFW